MKLLSKLFIACFLSSIVLVSCETEDDNFYQLSQVSPVLAANVPDTMLVGETYTLEITYRKDSDCHTFSGFDAVKQGDSLYYVRAITIFTQADNCNQEAEGILREANFKNSFESNFTFKFLKGKDSLGDLTYIDKDVIVM